MNNEELFIKFLMFVVKKLRYKKHISEAIFYNIDTTGKFYSFDIDILENNDNFTSLHIDLVRNQIIKSNKLIKKILASINN